MSTATVTAASPATVTATLRDAAGTAVSGQIVTFTAGTLGNLSAATALTNASGVATTTLSPASAATAGAAELTATATLNGTSLTATQAYQLTQSNVTFANFVTDAGASALSAYGQTNITATLAGVAAGSPVTVTLSSTCVAKGRATISPPSVNTTSGSASFIYKDQGCGATDTSDTVQATITSSTATASARLNLTSPAVNSITFASAVPPTIYLKGSGFTESSRVTFQVKDVANNPLPNQLVTMEATTLSGGLTLDGGSAPVQKRSDADGNVSVIVNSGTVPTPVRVRAVLSGVGVNTSSSNLSIAVGLPSQQNFSLSQTTPNIEGLDRDGTANTYRIIASDRLGNPVPDNTTVNFVAEGGQIQAVGQTSGNPGSAQTTVSFLSASPKPADGRITVVAYALGEESFDDLNGNNTFDTGEAFQDLGDVFLSRTFSDAYDATTDQFIPLLLSPAPPSTTCAAAGRFTARSADIPSRLGTCDSQWGRAYVRRAAETVLSTSAARPLWPSGTPPAGGTSNLGGACSRPRQPLQGDRNGTQANNLIVDGLSTIYSAPASGTIRIIVADANEVRLNPMAAGTTIKATGSTGLTVEVAGGSPVPGTLEATTVGITYTFTAGQLSGTITLTFTSPSGLSTSVIQPITTAANPGAACAP